MVAMKGREWHTIPSIYAQRLFMGHENNVATCVEELGSTKTYRRSERASKRTRIPNLVTAKSELSVAVNGRERSTIPSIYAQRLFMDHKNNVATGVEELGCTITYRRSERLPRWVEVPNLAHRQPNWICWSL